MSDDALDLDAKIRELSAYGGVIGADTDVVYDVRLGGDDLENLLAWLHQSAGVDFSEVRANDLPLNEPPQGLYTLLEKRKFKSMTVGALLLAMERKRWSWS